MKKVKIIAILCLIFVLAFLLRVWFLDKLSLTFGYDQARDAYISQEILKGDLKILGPPASTPGLYHGVFYYYLLAPAYFIGQGNPAVVAYWVGFLNALAVFVVFYLAYLFSKSEKAGLVSAFLFAISFESVQYATWLSNPTIGIWTVPLIYLGLWIWIKEKKIWGAVVSAVGLGLSIQAEIFLIYHIVPLVIWLWLSRKKIVKKQLAVFFLVLFISLSTMVASEVKFGFRGISGILSLLTSQDSIVASKGLGDFLILFLNQLGKVFAYSSYPGNIGYGGMIVFALIVATYVKWDKKSISWQPFLISWLLSHITVVSVGGTSTPFLLVGIGPAISILLGIYINSLLPANKIPALIISILLLFSNLNMIVKENPKGSTIFAIQKDMLLRKQISLIDYTYRESYGKPFVVNSLTSPLWINIVWTYLYKWHGQSKYGYVPGWIGRDQIGQLDSLPKTDAKDGFYYLILEPMGGIPQRYLEETLDEANAKSVVVDEDQYGELRVQKRIFKD